MPIAAPKTEPQECRMDRATTIHSLRDRTHQIAALVTELHPLIPGLADAPTQAELLKALFGLTREVESIKKHLLRLEKRDDSPQL